ncbi:MAG: asparagine synthase C-terminal domain-containing protein, partial [Candidatus Zixiibacteriota bacterium]
TYLPDDILTKVDRASMGVSLEARVPILDHRVVEFASKIPPLYKIHGLNEKFLLKKAMQKELPKEIIARAKQPYMAPDSNSFVQDNSPEYIEEMLSEERVSEFGLFNPDAVTKLKVKCRKLSHAHLSFKDNMSFIGILSTQLLYNQYIKDFKIPSGIGREQFKVWEDFS